LVYHSVVVARDPTAPIQWSPIVLPGSPSPWIVYSSLATLSPILTSVRSTLADPNWHRTMEEEYEALLYNITWDLVPRPPGANVITGKWIFKHKLKMDGSLE
jgi:hypothetical protein